MHSTDLLKTKLGRKQLTIGSWLSWSFNPTTEIMASAGFEWLVVDLEHTAIDYEEAQQMIRIMDLSGCTPLVRVGANDALIIKRVLDTGARGVLVPMVNSAEDAKRAVDAVYYPPKGKRGVGLSRAQQYGVGFDNYRERSMHESVVIAQIEHVEGVRNLEAILAVDGVDGFIIGPYDLTGSLNLPGQFEHPYVLSELDRVQAIMQASDKPGGYHVVQTDEAELRRRIREGYRFIAYGDDMVIFADKLRRERVIHEAATREWYEQDKQYR